MILTLMLFIYTIFLPGFFLTILSYTNQKIYILILISFCSGIIIMPNIFFLSATLMKTYISTNLILQVATFLNIPLLLLILLNIKKQTITKSTNE